MPLDFKSNDQLSGSEMRERISYYQKFIDIFQELAATFDLESLLRKIIQTASELTRAEAASILLYDEQNESLHFAAMTNANKEAQLHTMVVPKESLAGWVATNRESVIVEDVHKDQRWFTNVSKKIEFPTRSIIAVPMITQNRLIGVLEVLNKFEGTFNSTDEEYLKLLAAQAAVAINNTRLFQQSDLISELVHEIRTPLGSIATVAYLLQRKDLSDDQRIQLGQTIQQETERLNKMASNYLDFARLESGRLIFRASKFSLAELMDECILVLQPKIDTENLSCTHSYDDQNLMVEADREKMKQVLLNLISNAIKYNRPYGTIHVSFDQIDPKNVIIQIRDSGIGMSPDDLSHLFERFYRSARAVELTDGTGLGLSISKQIINAHGGDIQVESKPDQGTTFTIRIPLSLVQ